MSYATRDPVHGTGIGAKANGANGRLDNLTPTINIPEAAQ